jgi:hypothetical protein
VYPHHRFGVIAYVINGYAVVADDAMFLQDVHEANLVTPDALCVTAQRVI